jgi:hypothetical protein
MYENPTQLGFIQDNLEINKNRGKSDQTSVLLLENISPPYSGNTLFAENEN